MQVFNSKCTIASTNPTIPRIFSPFSQANQILIKRLFLLENK